MAEHDGHGLALVELLDRLGGGGSHRQPRSGRKQAKHPEQAPHVHSPPEKEFADPHNVVHLNSQTVIQIPSRAVRPRDFVYRVTLRCPPGEPEWPYRSLMDTSARAAAMSARRRRARIRIRPLIRATSMARIALPFGRTSPQCSSAAH